MALLAAVWLFLPGLLTTYGFGLRGVAAFALAPVVTIAIVAATAAVAGKLGVAWSVSLVVVVALVIAVSIAASLLPAVRAARVEPMEVLREE